MALRDKLTQRSKSPGAVTNTVSAPGSLNSSSPLGSLSAEQNTSGRSPIGKLLDKLVVQEEKDLSASQSFLFNFDLRPVERRRRLWSWFNYVFFWISDSFNINTWQIAATGIQAGLSWWTCWLSVWLGYSLTGIFVTVSARVGIYYHISFPVSCRSSFGVFGSIWPVFNRVVMACVWYGVQGYIGGTTMALMLRSIFGNDLNTRIPDGISSPNVTTFEFLSFFLFWLFSLPFIWLAPHTVRHLFTVKSYVVPVAGIAFLIWTIKKADGIGPVVKQPSTISGSEFGWAFIRSVMNSLANFATLIVNAPDFSRFSKTKASAKWAQLFSIPLCFSITSLIGILVSSASTIIYGETYWSPIDVLGRFLDNYTSGNRAGVFFISFAFALAQLGTNISANSLSAGTDATALLPRYITIRRGGYICAAVGLCICPWELLSSSNKFTTYLSAYSVFLSAIFGVLFADYYIVRRGWLVLNDLYNAEKTSAYTYWHGINYRAFVAYICGILPNIVGFVGATGAGSVPQGAMYVYDFNFFAGFGVSVFIYVLLCYIHPLPGVPYEIKKDLFKKGWYEEYAEVENFDVTGGAASGEVWEVVEEPIEYYDEEKKV
ncbi:hypothetical protein LJB42_004697 [Komagataella kurtzmanii]|nr:hypothetical protein LJB42_004697 [Komagataella kurtzmanii]